jgi:hypothetical protein
MLLRVRRDGLAVCVRSPHQQRAALILSQAAASAQSHGLNSTSPYPTLSGTFRPQLRVLQTWTHTKGLQSTRYPQHTPRSLNWTSTAHRTRHIAAAMTSLTHSHGHAGHHHHHDNTFLLSKNKDDAGVRITRIGLYVNLGMAVGKGFGGYVFNSQGRETQETREKRRNDRNSDRLQRLLPTPSTA